MAIDLKTLPEQELRDLAKEKGISSWHVKGLDRLIQELQAMQPEVVTEVPKPEFPEQPRSYERVQIQRGNARLGILKQDINQYLREGWVVIGAP